MLFDNKMKDAAIIASGLLVVCFAVLGLHRVVTSGFGRLDQTIEKTQREFTVWQLFWSDSETHDKQSWYDWAAEWASWLSLSEQEDIWQAQNDASYYGWR